MKKRTIVSLIAIAALVSVQTFAGCIEEETPTPLPTPVLDDIPVSDEETVRLGAFNIQVFGKSKTAKPEVMAVLGEIIRTYDVVAIKGNFDVTLIVIHTDPDEATEEINALVDVVKYTQRTYPDEQDFIVMGDLNADGSYFNEESASAMNSSDYYWCINNSLDTTTRSTNYTYDRIIITNQTVPDFCGESGVFRYDIKYGLTAAETTAVSDHYIDSGTSYLLSAALVNYILLKSIYTNLGIFGVPRECQLGLTGNSPVGGFPNPLPFQCRGIALWRCLT